MTAGSERKFEVGPTRRHTSVLWLPGRESTRYMPFRCVKGFSLNYELLAVFPLDLEESPIWSKVDLNPALQVVL